MKLISVNIQANLHKETILEFLRKENPDVVCMQELLEEDFEFFKQSLGLEGIHCIWRYLLNTSAHRFLGKRDGVAIFSKNIIDSGLSFHIGQEENVLKSLEEYSADENLQNNNAFAWAIVRDDFGKEYKIITIHIPVTKEGESTPYQLEVVDALINKLESFGEFVLCGDMNAPRGRETFSRLARKFKDNIPEFYQTSLDQNLHRVKGLQLMVDGLFTTPKYVASNVKLVDRVSDHMAIVAEIN